jgi:hypothetical protein
VIIKGPNFYRKYLIEVSVLGLCGSGFSQHLGLFLEQLGQQHLDYF